jgi:hypothetical protein
MSLVRRNVYQSLYAFELRGALGGIVRKVGAPQLFICNFDLRTLYKR